MPQQRVSAQPDLFERLASLAPVDRERILKQMEAMARAMGKEGRPARPGDGMMVATKTFTVDYDGEQITVTAGKTRMVPDHEIVERHPESFEPWEPSSPQPDAATLDRAWKDRIYKEKSALKCLRANLQVTPSPRRVIGQHRRAPTRRRHATVRSSAASGDSGDSDSGDGNPPGVETPPAGRESAEKTCRADGCDTSIAGRATQAVFCSEACQKRAERAEKKRRGIQSKPERAAREALEPRRIPDSTFGSLDKLQREMETDGDGQYLGPNSQRRILGSPAQLRGRRELGERRAKERATQQPTPERVESILAREDRDVKALCVAIMSAHTAVEHRNEPEDRQQRGQMLGKLRSRLNGSYVPLIESSFPFSVADAAAYIEQVAA